MESKFVEFKYLVVFELPRDKGTVKIIYKGFQDKLCAEVEARKQDLFWGHWFHHHVIENPNFQNNDDVSHIIV